MYSDEKRGHYGVNTYNTFGKVTNETEYDMRLRIIKEKYEERLEAITDKVKCIYEDLRRDEVISTMRSDPASGMFISHRMKEICEDHLSIEREETIDRLTEEVGFTQMELKKAEKENRDLRHNLELTQETFNGERTRMQGLEQENKSLRSKLNNFTREFEEVHKKNFNNTCEAMKHTAIEAEQLKEALDTAENALWQRAKENEVLKSEAERTGVLVAEVNKLSAEVKERERVQKEDVRIINELRDEMSEVSREREELRNKQNSYGQQFKDIIETEERAHQAALKEISDTNKEKSTRFKKKILEQKKIISIMENEIALAREVAESSKHGQEKSLVVAQEDLKKVKDQWERRCKDVEKENSIHISEIQAKHQSQIAELQRHYQEMLEERIKEFQSDHSTHLSKQKALDYELKRIMDERILQIEKEYISISKHENILHEETSKLRIKQLQEIRDVEENCNKEILTRIKDLKEQNLQDSERFSQRIVSLEQEKADFLAAKRIAESELGFAEEKVEVLQRKIHELQREVADSEATRRDQHKRIEEVLSNLDSFKSRYEELVFQDKQQRKELDLLKEKNENLQNCLSEIERDYSFKHQNTSLTHQEQLSEQQTLLLKEQQKQKKLVNDLEYYQTLCTKLESDIQEIKDQCSIQTQEFFTNSQRSKQEEYLKYDKEVESHLETKRQLIQAEHKVNFLTAELESNEKLGNELRVLTTKYERDLSELRRTVTALEKSISQHEKLNGKLKKEVERSKEEQNSIRIVSKQALKESLDRLRLDLKSLKKSSAQEMSNFTKTMNSGLGDTMFAVEDFQNKSKRLWDSRLYEKEEELRVVKKQKIMFEDELNKSLQAHGSYENNIEQLRNNLAQLKGDVSKKNQEIETFNRKIEEFQYDRIGLEEEKRRLEEELKITYSNLESYRQESVEYQGKWKVGQDSLEKETEFQQSLEKKILRYKEVISELQVQAEGQFEKFTNQINFLQTQQRDEVSKLAQRYEQELQQYDKELRAEANKSKMLRAEIEALQDSVYRIEERTKDLLVKLEEDVIELQHSITEDKQKFQKFRGEKLSEIESMRIEIKRNSSELNLKNDIIEKLENDKEELRGELREQRENSGIKQIQELKGRLAKSYHHTVETVKQAKELERETEQLTRQAKLNPDARAKAYLNQLKNSN